MYGLGFDGSDNFEDPKSSQLSSDSCNGDETKSLCSIFILFLKLVVGILQHIIFIHIRDSGTHEQVLFLWNLSAVCIFLTIF